MSDIESINSSQSKHFSDHSNEDYISRTNSYSTHSAANPHSIFERTVEEPLCNTPLLMHQAQRRLSRTNSIVSFSSNNNYSTQPITINSNSRSTSNLSNLYRTSSQASVNRRTSVISTQRHNENFIAPSLDSTCHIINDNNTTIDDIQIEDHHPLSTSATSSVCPDSPNNSIFSPPGTSNNDHSSNINRTSPGTSPTSNIKGPLSRRPSTIGLDMALGIHREEVNTNNEQQSPPLRLNTFGFSNTNNNNSNNNINNGNVASGLNSAISDSPRLIRFQSYADILTEESSSLRRPSFGNANSSSLSVKPQLSQSSQDMLEFQFGKQPSLLRKNSITSHHNLSNSPMSSPLHASKPSIGSQHPLKNVVKEGVRQDIFEKVTPQAYRKFDSNEKSPFHQLLSKD